MRVLYFAAGLEAKAGGPSRAIPVQCQATHCGSIQVGLAFVDSGIEVAPEVLLLEPLGIKTCPLSKRELFATLPRIVKEYDVVHIHGIWSFECIWTSFIAYRLKKRVVFSLHGVLEPWAINHKRTKKQIAWQTIVGRLVNSCDAVQATALSEGRNAREFGITCPIAVIPNCVSVPDFSSSAVGTSRENRILFLSRLHPQKGTIELIRSLANLKEVLDEGNWRLVIAGPDPEGHKEAIIREAALRGVINYIDFVGAVDGASKWDLYRTAGLFVLPSFGENFALVVAEALGCGVPCITTQAAPWSELVSNDCGWWPTVGQQALDVALAEALRTSPERRREMGNNGIALIKKMYGSVGQSLALREFYEWILDRDGIPSCFPKDLNNNFAK
jgi:glycosyltransferase involved in cell wall biosynthesis